MKIYKALVRISTKTLAREIVFLVSAPDEARAEQDVKDAIRQSQTVWSGRDDKSVEVLGIGEAKVAGLVVNMDRAGQGGWYCSMGEEFFHGG